MPELTIGQVARQAGVATSTVRYYESIGLLPEPRRVSGRRRYDPDVLQQLALIQTAQRAGFTLDEARVLLYDILPSAAPKESWQGLVQRKLHEVNALMRHVEQMRTLLEDVMNCDSDELADCIYVTGQKYTQSVELP
jgi:MerR family redox-sensitive transcriptional activator SoxR